MTPASSKFPEWTYPKHRDIYAQESKLALALEIAWAALDECARHHYYFREVNGAKKAMRKIRRLGK